jgi:hypothetical protein
MIALGRMPRFYFDVTTDAQFVPDELGLDLPSLAGARKEARVTAAEMAKRVTAARTKSPLRSETRMSWSRPCGCL